MNYSSGRQRGVTEEEDVKRKVKGMGSKHICCPNEIRTIVDHEEIWPAGSSNCTPSSNYCGITNCI